MTETNQNNNQNAYNQVYGANVPGEKKDSTDVLKNASSSYSPLSNNVTTTESHTSGVISTTPITPNTTIPSQNTQKVTVPASTQTGIPHTNPNYMPTTQKTSFPSSNVQPPVSGAAKVNVGSASQTSVFPNTPNASTASAASSPASGNNGTQDAKSTAEVFANADVDKSGKGVASLKRPDAKVFVLAFVGALIACILFFAIGSFAGIFGTKTTLGGTSSSTNSTPITASSDSDGLAEQVSAKCLPSVVSVNVYGTASTSSGSSIFDYLNGNSGNSNSTELTQTSTGSGVIISTDGYIVTNQHVIDGGKKYEVVVEGDTIEAKLVGQDSSSDIAVLKVDTDKTLTAMEFADSDQITTGEWVMSIGNPFGLEQSVATGIVSATSRSQIVDNSSSSNSYNSSSSSEATIYPNMIQTDAAINPGNSGGALVDKSGKLIGINTLITSYSGNYSGVGFAIPVNYAIGIAKNLIEGKNPTYAQLGVSLSTINETYAKRFGFAVNEGAYVAEVSSGSGADKAGIQKGDIITEFEGEKVTSASDLTLDVRKKNPGDTATIKLYRGNEEKTLQVTLGEGESTSSDSGSSNSQGNGNSGSGSGSGSGTWGQNGQF